MTIHVGGRGMGHMCRKFPALLAAPTFTSSPVVSGTASVGNTLSVADGAVTGSPSPTITRQWYSNTANSTSGATLLAGDTDTSLFLDDTLSGLYIFCTDTATNHVGSATSNSNIAGPVAAAAGLTAPTLTLTSATGATPEWDTALAADAYAGYYLHIEASADGVTGAGGAYTTPTRSIDHQISASDVALGPDGKGTISHAELVTDGWSDVTGTWHIHSWIFREDGVKSGVSNDLTGTVSAFIAELASTTGFDKSQYLTLSNGNLSAVMNGNPGSISPARVEPSITGKRHIEFNIDSMDNAFASGAGNLAFGVCGEVQNFQSTGIGIPGNTSSATDWQGATCRLNWDSVNAQLYYAGSAHPVALPGAANPAVGDKVILEFDTTANTVSFYYYRNGGATAQIGTTITISGDFIPAAWHAFGAGFHHHTIGDGFTMNSGQGAFIMTPTTGYAGW